MGLFGNTNYDELLNTMQAMLAKLDNLSKSDRTAPETTEPQNAPEPVKSEEPDALKQKEEQLHKLEESLKAREASLDKKEAELTERENALKTAETPKPTEPEKQDKPEVQITATTENDNKAFEGLNKKLEDIFSKIEDIEYKDKIIKDLHEDLRENRRDFTAELSKPFFHNLIKIHSMLRGVYMRFTKETAGKEDEIMAKILHEMENNMHMVQDMLEQEYNLEYYEPELNSKYIPKEHIGLQAIATDDESKAGTIAEVIYGGFRDLNNDKVFKQALVKPYKLEK